MRLSLINPQENLTGTSGGRNSGRKTFLSMVTLVNYFFRNKKKKQTDLAKFGSDFEARGSEYLNQIKELETKLVNFLLLKFE
jgi:hypothetical protein